MDRTNRNPTFKAWCAMRNRCYNTKNAAYATHGGSGISVCERWLGPSGFANFVADMGERPSPLHRFKRLDVSRNYEADNCRWIKNAGMHGTRTYTSWLGMIDRCYREKNKRYELYGARGIRVCDRWMGRDGFQNFLSDMGECPDGYSIDRINSDGNYEPSNCRWADATTQSRNRRYSRFTDADILEIRRLHENGMTQTAIAKLYGVWQTTISDIVREVTWVGAGA